MAAAGQKDGEQDELSEAAKAKLLAEAELKNAPDFDKTNRRLQELSDRILFLENKLPDVENTLALEISSNSKDFQKTTKYIMEAQDSANAMFNE